MTPPLKRRVGMVAAIAVTIPTALLSASLALAAPVTITPVVPTITHAPVTQAPIVIPTPPAAPPTVSRSPSIVETPRVQPSETVPPLPPAEVPRNTPTTMAPPVTPPEPVTTRAPTAAKTTPPTIPPVAPGVTTAPMATTSGPPQPVKSPAVTNTPFQTTEVAVTPNKTIRSTLKLPTPSTVQAPATAVQAAKVASAAVIDPATPPPLPPTVDFTKQIQTQAPETIHGGRGSERPSRPKVWDYVDYDAYHRPILYNPIDQDLTFRYYYDGSYRELYVPAGGRVLLSMAVDGVFPFTAVGANYVTVGSFYGGAWVPPYGYEGPPPPDWSPPPPPVVYDDVNAYVPSVGRTVTVNKVMMVGHDDTKPAGQQDAFMLDDSTMAWGQVHDGRDGGSIDVTKTQSLPGVGPTDDGRSIIDTALETTLRRDSTWEWWLGGAILATLIAGGVITWVIRHPRSAHAVTTDLSNDVPTQR